MSETKTYYWLKLKQDFFKEKEIKKLRRIAGGDTYTIIYLKLMLLSLKDTGNLYFENIEDSFAEELALELDEDAENVKVTLLYLAKMGLLQEVNASEIVLTRIPECIGKETNKAELMRKKRAREKQNLIDGNIVTPLLPDVTNCYTEKEIDIDLDLEKEKENKKNSIKQSLISYYSEVIQYLNDKAQTKFRASSKATQTLIHARMVEGFSVDDFKTVIDKKTVEWMGTEFEQYLRPQTLFGTKFESYLNAPTVKRKNSGVSVADIEAEAESENVNPFAEWSDSEWGLSV